MTKYNSAFDLMNLSEPEKKLIELKSNLMLKIRDHLEEHPDKKKEADQDTVNLIYSGLATKLTLDTLVLMASNYGLKIPLQY